MDERGELQDWEVLPNSDVGFVSDNVSVVKSGVLGGVSDSTGMIRADYFASDSAMRHGKPVVDSRGYGFSDSSAPNLGDSSLGSDYIEKSESFSGSGKEKSNLSLGSLSFAVDFEVGEGDNGKNELGFKNSEEQSDFGPDFGEFVGSSVDGKGKSQIEIGDFGEKVEGELGNKISEEQSNFWLDSGGFARISVEAKGSSQMDLGEFGEKVEGELGYKNSEDQSNFWSDSGEFAGSSVEGRSNDQMGIGEFGEIVEGGSDSAVFLEEEVDGGMNSGGVVVAEGEEDGLNSSDVAAMDVSGGSKFSEGENGRMVWWKLPLELLKFCAFRVSPVWSISIAAAVMGFVILGRRLYKMRHKSRSFPLKVSVEDKKKVARFMIQAAKLNEAFSVARRVHVVRTTVPVVGLTPWPAMNLR